MAPKYKFIIVLISLAFLLVISGFTFVLLPSLNSYIHPAAEEVIPVSAVYEDTKPVLEKPAVEPVPETNSIESSSLHNAAGVRSESDYKEEAVTTQKALTDAGPSSGVTTVEEYSSLPQADSMTAPVKHQLTTEEQLDLKNFALPLQNGDSQHIRGIYASGIFQFQVQQQPKGDMGYVSIREGVVTEFARARSFNVTGFLAHNFAAGRLFYNLAVGDMVHVVYGDGSYKSYRITALKRYQALKGNDPNSDFIDLETGEQMTAATLFKQVYSGEHHLTLQTCIQQGDNQFWGRYFVIGEPVETVQAVGL